MHLNGTRVSLTCIFLAVLSSMGGFCFGYDTGQIADILVMSDFKARFAQQGADGTYAFSNVRSGLIVGMLSIGTLIGALSGRYLSDWLGRRWAISIFTIFFSLGAIIQGTAVHAWYQVMIGRIIAGLGIGGLSAAVPVYQSESVPKQLRGTLIATYQLLITFGILLAYCISIGTRGMNNSGQWRIVILISIVFAAFLGIGIQFCPESPRWLAARGRREEALHSLARVRGTSIDDPLVYADMNEIITAQEKLRKAGNGSWAECFVGYAGGRRIAYRTFLGMMLQALQQLTGANYFFYYGATVFQSVGITDTFVVQIILGAVNFLCTFPGLYILEKYGRRWPLIIGALWESAWLFVFASVGTADDPSKKSTGTVMIVSACLFILGYASTWGPGIWILTGETFEMRNRARQAALATASNWLWNFLLAFFTPFITNNIDFSYGYVFAGCNLFAAFFVFFFLYESGGISLEAVNAMYYTEDLKPWQSNSWAPEPYASRAEAVRDEKLKAQADHLEFTEGRGAPAGRSLSVDSQRTALDPEAARQMNEKTKVKREANGMA